MTDATPLPDPVLYCECARSGRVPEETRQRVLRRLERCGRPVTRVADLCGLAAARNPLLARLAQARRLTLVACHPRAVRWLFHRAGASLEPARMQCFNLREQPLDDILAALPEAEPGPARPVARTPEAGLETGGPDTGARPWFPVIDYDRCTRCRQCLEFCLFGVYDTDASGRVVVRRPSHCKDQCPACARLCPALAIMFPKLDEDSPICGNDKDAASAPGRVGLSREQLFGERALDRLRARAPRRPPLFRQP